MCGHTEEVGRQGQRQESRSKQHEDTPAGEVFMHMQMEANTSLSAGRKTGGHRRWHQDAGIKAGGHRRAVDSASALWDCLNVCGLGVGFFCGMSSVSAVTRPTLSLSLSLSHTHTSYVQGGNCMGTPKQHAFRDAGNTCIYICISYK